MSKNVYNVGLIGCGAVARRVHLPILKSLEKKGLVKIIAICDINENALKRASAEFGIKRAYNDANKMLENEEIDIAVVLVPTPLHAQLAINIAKRKINAIIEKPLCLKFKEAIEIDEAFKKNNVKYTVVFNYRYNPVIIKAKKLIEEGRIGDVKSICSIANTLWPNQWTRSTWLYSEIGVIADFAPHVFFASLWLIDDEIKSIYAHSKYTNDKSLIAGADILAETTKNKSLYFNLSWISGTFLVELKIIGSGGIVEVLPRDEILHIYRGFITPLDYIKKNTKYIFNNSKDIVLGRYFTKPYIGVKLIYTHFIYYLKGWIKEPPILPKHILNVSALIEGAYKSIKTGRIITMESLYKNNK